MRADKSGANQPCDEVFTRDKPDQISLLIDDRGQAKPCHPQPLDRAGGWFAFLHRDHPPQVTRERLRPVFVEKNIEHVDEANCIAAFIDDRKAIGDGSLGVFLSISLRITCLSVFDGLLRYL